MGTTSVVENVSGTASTTAIDQDPEEGAQNTDNENGNSPNDAIASEDIDPLQELPKGVRWKLAKPKLRNAALSFLAVVIIMSASGGIMSGIEYPNEVAVRDFEVETFKAIFADAAAYTEQEQELVDTVVKKICTCETLDQGGLIPNDIKPNARKNDIRICNSSFCVWYADQANYVNNWEANFDYFGGTYFALTVMTTIGYGNFTPATDGGKFFTIIIAVFGIVATYIALSTIGDLLVFSIKSIPLARKIKNATLVASIILLAIFIFLGAGIFTALEEIGFGDGVYFTIITLTTVGLGDIAPERSRLFWLFYILFGLGFVANLITEVGDAIASRYAKRREKVRNKMQAWREKRKASKGGSTNIELELTKM